MRDSLKKTLMDRDGITEAEAQNQVDEARDQLMEMIESGEECGAHDICQDLFGLEPDYLEDLLF